MFILCYELLKRDLLLIYRQRSDFIQPLAFFVIVIILFPLAISPDKALLAEISPGLIWVAVLLSMLLAMPQLFFYDFIDGSLEQQLISPCPLTIFVLVRLLVHWLSSALPLILITPLMGLWLAISAKSLTALLLSLLLGTPVFSILSAVIVALTIGLRQNGTLLALLVLPLIVPVLIFGTGATVVAGLNQHYTAQLAWLGAILAVAITTGPTVIAGALRVGIN